MSTFSEYGVYDSEEDSEDDDGDLMTPTSIHNDLNEVQETSSDSVPTLDEYSFDTSSSLVGDEMYTFDPGGKVLGIILENEKRSEVSQAPRLS